MWRVNTAAGVTSPPPLFTTAVANVYVAMGATMPSDYAVESAVFYPRDSDISVPAALPVIEDGDLPHLTTNAPGSVANSWSFVGRGANGSRWLHRWFGIQDGLFNSLNGDFRYSPAENSIVGDVLAAYRALVGLCAIDRGGITFKSYANCRVDSKYQSSLRG